LNAVDVDALGAIVAERQAWIAASVRATPPMPATLL
jgi:hypothetical protein